MRVVRLAVWGGAVALALTAAPAAIAAGVLSSSEAAAHYAAFIVAITVALVVWQRRPQNAIGPLMAGAWIASMIGELDAVFRGSALAVTAAYASAWLGAPLLVHMTLSYPTGRLTSRLDRGFVAVAWTYAITWSAAYLLFYSPREPNERDIWDCPDCALPYTHVAWHDLHGPRWILDRVALALVVVFLALVVRKLVRASRGARRVLLPLLSLIVFLAARLGVELGLTITGSRKTFWTSSTMFWLETVGVLCVPVALGAGVLWGRTARAAVADLVVELEGTPPDSLRDALAHTLGDPTLELALWLPDRECYVNGDGRPLRLPSPGSGRAVTPLGPTELPVGALVHDPALLEQPALLRSVGAAARLALENARLQAELRLQLSEVRASRARIVRAGDEERRRLERDLHDGAQQRLLSLGLALQLVRAELGADANGAATVLGEAEAELAAALDELRRLAHGIHPAVLTEHGLAPALQTLAARAPLPVEIRALPAERLPPPVEAAAYFVVSEALANAAKHAAASAVWISVTCGDASLVVEVEDDGRGGADAARGSGIAGLADRVHALEGRLIIASPGGGGTRLRAELPLRAAAAHA